MIAELKPYPEYKNSGVVWLGQLPEGWDVLRGRQLFEIKKRISGVLGHRVLSVTQGGLRVRDVESGQGQLSQDYSKYQTVEIGEFAMNSMDLLTGGVGIATSPGVTSPDYRVFALRNKTACYARYMLHVLRMLYRNKGFYAWGQGSAQLGRWRLPRRRFNDFPFPVPSFSEQAAIAQFLDWANGRLEGAMRTKRKVIALLNEQKQAIIHRAVTRGLGPSVPLMPSGSRWFEQVPPGWHVLTLRKLITAAIDGPHFSPKYQDDGIAFLSARNVRSDRWVLGNAKFISEADYIEFSKRVRPEIGDVLYTKGGTTGVARAVDLTFPFQVWVHIAVLKLKPERIAPLFLAYCLNSPRCYEQAQLFTRGATNQDLGLGRMKEIELPVPPTLGEQNAIVDFLETQCTSFTDTISRLEREIELLREYRTRLVADIVTGKLDVREAATRLPDEGLLDTTGDDAEIGEEIEAEDEEASG